MLFYYLHIKKDTTFSKYFDLKANPMLTFIFAIFRFIKKSSFHKLNTFQILFFKLLISIWPNLLYLHKISQGLNSNFYNSKFLQWIETYSNIFIVCWVFCNVVFSDSLKKVKAGPIMQIASSFKRLSSLQGLPHRSPKAMTILFFLLLFYAAMILLPWKTSINKARKWKKQEKGRKKEK